MTVVSDPDQSPTVVSILDQNLTVVSVLVCQSMGVVPVPVCQCLTVVSVPGRLPLLQQLTNASVSPKSPHTSAELGLGLAPDAVGGSPEDTVQQAASSESIGDASQRVEYGPPPVEDEDEEEEAW